MNRISLLLLSVVTIFFLPNKTVSQSVEELANKAEIEISSGSYTEALETINVLTERSLSEDQEILFIYWRGLVNSELKNNVEAVRDLSFVINRHPEFSPGYALRANAKAEMNDYIGAVDDLKTANKFEESAINYFNKARFMGLSGQFPLIEIAENFIRSTELDPTFGGAHLQAGQALFLVYDVESLNASLNNKDEYSSQLSALKRKACLHLSKAGELGIESAYEMIEEKCNMNW
ncbi:tetratricopeptide repeat protein [Rhodohalobacter halophilus]|uniref:hypothetical protein n=1 Tax=Rhodohalobacter halophilus TaxID=1812810 RepID=UPI00083F61DF|nr:hypothetical protein [Rhodohalobacter halophilus]